MLVHSMRPSCPLCGCGWSFYPGARELDLLGFRVQMLHHSMQEIALGTLRVAYLRQHVSQMCWMCQMLMIGVTNEFDRRELISRLQRDIEEMRTRKDSVPEEQIGHGTITPGDVPSL